MYGARWWGGHDGMLRVLPLDPATWVRQPCEMAMKSPFLVVFIFLNELFLHCQSIFGIEKGLFTFTNSEAGLISEVKVSGFKKTAEKCHTKRVP